MASTSWQTLPNAYPTLQIRVNYSSMTRSDNTVTINGVSATIRISLSGGFDGDTWTGTVYAGYD